eukprot:GEMP01041498.1.p1 GENE.GEMP01041498.1~~GEMP01041498.1.p1  ORF type:complete len:354 (+),score=85.33 GEMP01041498.1:66-1127(+)
MTDWFATLFGFNEENYAQTKGSFEVNAEVNTLISKANGKSFGIGEFETPSVGELRERYRSGCVLAEDSSTKLKLRIVSGDVRSIIQDPANALSTFQVASQFNCLEFTAPSIVPEQGITRYQSDHTQGPACAMTCAAATVYRNYFAPTNGKTGQSRDNQIDNLADVKTYLGADFDMNTTGGYTIASPEKLTSLNARIEKEPDDGDQIVQRIRVGVHKDIDVTSGKAFQSGAPQKCTQVLASACSVSYNRGPPKLWKPFALLVLRAAYEGCLLAAIENKRRHTAKLGSGKCYLSMVGGGAFGNSTTWVSRAMEDVLIKYKHENIEVILVSYDKTPKLVEDMVEEFQKRTGSASTS